MGLVLLPARRVGDQSDAGPIGAWSRRHTIAVSTIRLDQRRASFVYGPEVDADLVVVSRQFLRRSPAHSVSFMRVEIRVPAGASPDIRAGGRVSLSEMPVGQRRVHEARVQTYARRAAPRFFEDFPDLPPELRDTAALASVSDDDAIRALHEMPVNVFETQKCLVASFLANRVASFASYDDREDDDTGSREAKVRIADASFSIGAVADPDVVRNAIWTDKTVCRMFAATAEGRLKVKASATGPEVSVSPEVGFRAADHLYIAISQAMAGAGQKAEALVGTPVATYARWLFERHLYTAVERLSGRSPPIADIGPEDLENLTAADERD